VHLAYGGRVCCVLAFDSRAEAERYLAETPWSGERTIVDRLVENQWENRAKWREPAVRTQEEPCTVTASAAAVSA
jgi:DNA-binding transcriptional ArsR family regulator